MSCACQESLTPLVVHVEANFGKKFYKDSVMYFCVYAESVFQ